MVNSGLRVRKLIREQFDRLVASVFSSYPSLGAINEQFTPKVAVSPSEFPLYTYARKPHFYSLVIPETYHHLHLDFCDLKVYQDLLAYNFLIQNLSPGAKILEIGGGHSRVIGLLSRRFECWNLDKLEGVGFGPKGIGPVAGFTQVKDYIGAFNISLPDGYFDCVFSISALEHVAEDPQALKNIWMDISRLIKPGGYSFHCIDIVMRRDHFYTNKILAYLYDQVEMINPLVPFEVIANDPELWTLPKYTYYAYWMMKTKKSIRKFGIPSSYNILWQKA